MSGKHYQESELSGVTVDVEQVNRLLNDLRVSDQEFTKAVKSAYRRSLSIIRKEVRKGAATVTSDKIKLKGIRVSVYRNGSGGRVDILKPQTGYPGVKTKVFILKWLELGTKEVIGKNDRKHGATPAKPFFNAAVSRAQSQAESVLSDNIIKYINKVASKRKV